MGREIWKCMKQSTKSAVQQKPKKPKKTRTISVWQKIASEINDQQLCDDAVISIEKMLKGLPQVNAKCNIYHVTKVLCEMNPKAYVPQIISIGPFHHGTRKDLIDNEKYKLHGFINFLRRINIESIVEGGISETARSLKELLKTGTLKALVKKAHGWMKEALNCYATPINMKEEDFIIMMLVDACFIVEFFILKVDDCHPNWKFDLIQENVDISFYEGIEVDITDDMIKLENQVPFSLLEHLFEEIPKKNVPIRSKFREEKEFPISSRDDKNVPIRSKVREEKELPISRDDENVPISFKDLAHWALKSGLVGDCEIDLNKKPDHLVDFLICYFVPFPAKNMQNNSDNNCLSFLCHIPFSGCWQKLDGENNDQTKNNDCLTLFKPLCHLWNKIACKEKKSEEGSSNIPPSITELSEAGVSIKKAENGKYMRNITFKNGVLEIPPLHIYDNFELMLRNMVAFEQYTAGNKDKYVTQYVLFLDNLISTEKDVHLLVKAGVIINNIGGSDKEVSDLFNNLGKFVTQSSSPHYDSISKALREHCNGCWNKAKASLKHNYFNTPWAFISFFAAIFLILLTILQTIFSGITTFPKQHTA